MDARASLGDRFPPRLHRIVVLMLVVLVVVGVVGGDRGGGVTVVEVRGGVEKRGYAAAQLVVELIIHFLRSLFLQSSSPSPIGLVLGLCNGRWCRWQASGERCFAK